VSHPVADAVVRSIVLDADREAVWRAISSDDGLAGWLAESARVDVRPGGEGSIRFAGGHDRHVRVDEVELGRSFSFRWAPDSLPEAETRVELRLEDADNGRTRITVSESGFARAVAQASGRVAVSAWAWEAALVALAALFALILVA
jgi:uncharacterized protein YndB with AHSA1/START domain